MLLLNHTMTTLYKLVYLCTNISSMIYLFNLYATCTCNIHKYTYIIIILSLVSTMQAFEMNDVSVKGCKYADHSVQTMGDKSIESTFFSLIYLIGKSFSGILSSILAPSLLRCQWVSYLYTYLGFRPLCACMSGIHWSTHTS